MAVDPTFYTLESPIDPTGMNHGDVHKILYDLVEAIKAICDMIDADIGVIGVDYGETIGDVLATAVAKLKTPTQGDTET